MKYTIKEVRQYARITDGMVSLPKLTDMLTELAERIEADKRTQSCEKCKGRGEVFNDVHVRMMTCPHCHGAGKVAPAKDAEQVRIWNKWPQGWER